MFREGDVVTVGSNPTIKLGESKMFLKPYVSVSRKLSADVAGDLAALELLVRSQLLQAIRNEITFVVETVDAIDEGDPIDSLVKWCNAEMEKSGGHVHAEIEGQGQGQGPAKVKVGKFPKPKPKPKSFP